MVKKEHAMFQSLHTYFTHGLPERGPEQYIEDCCLFFFSPPQKRQASAILNAYTCAVVSLTNIWPHHAALSLLPHKGTGEENMMKKGSTVEIRTGRLLTNLPSWAKQTGHREINLLPASNRLEQWELLWAWSTSCSSAPTSVPAALLLSHFSLLSPTCYCTAFFPVLTS